MDPLTVIVGTVLMLSVSGTIAYTCFFRPEVFDAQYQSNGDKPKRLFGKEIPDKAERYAVYRQIGITGVVIALFALFGLVRAIIDLMNT